MTKPFTHRVMRSDATLAPLPLAQRDAIYAYCDDHTLMEATTWIKALHKIQISDTALSNWLKRETKRRQLEHLLEPAMHFQDTKDASLSSPNGGESSLSCTSMPHHFPAPTGRPTTARGNAPGTTPHNFTSPVGAA
ncbi:MAG: hypothetical protein WCD79_01985 [Chthoniobacteraceae bacterium]